MTLLLAFLVMLLIVGAMSLGVLLGRRPITGSCGGMARLGLDASCEVCGGDRAQCRAENGAREETLAYDATQVRKR
jgi:uncharacterized protein